MASRKINENLIYFILWIIVMALPIMTLRDAPDFSFNRIMLEWVKISPFLIVFFINNTVLVPKLLFRNKNLQYLIITTTLIVIVAYLFNYTKLLHDLIASDMPLRPDGQNIGQPLVHEGLMPRNGRLPRHPIARHTFSQGVQIVDVILFSYLVVGFNCAIKFVFKRQEDEKATEIQRNIHLETELSFLKNQVSPHFFMNTLNNIHSLIDYDAEIAKESVIALSKLMRHILYDSQGDKISLKKEMDFVKNYVELMKLRSSDKVKISLNIPENYPDKHIPPMLFVSYIENAFKHGISFQIDSFIAINFDIQDDKLIFSCINSNAARKNDPAHIGIGIENSRKRLDIIFGNSYDLIIDNGTEIFTVNLEIPL